MMLSCRLKRVGILRCLSPSTRISLPPSVVTTSFSFISFREDLKSFASSLVASLVIAPGTLTTWGVP